MEVLHHPFSGLLILLILGLRHGLDPDHITVIDNFTYKLHQQQSKWSRWVGTLFTLGHGIMVTLIAVALSLLKNTFEFSESLNLILEWVPVVILLAMGISNLSTLTNRKSTKQKKISKLKNWMLPKPTGGQTSPVSILITGIVFGFIFDTSSQIAAFGITLSASQQWMFAMLGGLIFSLGLIITGTCDSFLVNNLLKVFDRKKINSHRFKLNVLITIMCFAIPTYKLICFINPIFELTDFQNNIVGLAFIGTIVLLYTELYLKYKLVTAKVDAK